MLSRKKILCQALFFAFLPAAVCAAEVNLPTVAAPAVAALPPPAPHVSAKTSAAANEIADINERVAVLSARLAELEMQAKIAGKLTEINKADGSSAGDTYIPTVMSISGIDGNFRASIYVRGGNTQSVRVGDRVGAWKIKNIQVDSVTVQKGREVLRLGFGSSPATQDAGTGMPGMSPPLRMPGQ